MGTALGAWRHHVLACCETCLVTHVNEMHVTWPGCITRNKH